MFWTQEIPQIAGSVARELAQRGRAHLPVFLDPRAAQALRGALNQIDWALFTNQGGERQSLQAQDLSGQESAVMQRINAEAAHSFRFAFDGFDLSDACLSGQLRQGELHDFFLAANMPNAIALYRALTGDARIVYLDTTAVRYRAGHFATTHRGDVAGDDALFGYVLDFTPPWRAEWGGLVSFITEDDHVAEAYTPRMGALSIFRADALHAVSAVAPFAPGPRHAIAGWMRSKRPTVKPA